MVMNMKKEIQMGQYLNLDQEKIQNLLDIKLKFFKGELSKEAARDILEVHYNKVTAQEFAICEQYLQEYGITDQELQEKMADIIYIFEHVLEAEEMNLQKGHPVQTYLDEIAAIRAVLEKIKEQQKAKFIKNQWLELYEKLAQINIHFSRKQNQLFPALEKKGFDKPSKVMWSLDNKIRDTLKEVHTLLKQDQDQAFLQRQEEVVELVEDMMLKETEILLPTAMELLTDDDFILMRKSDDEIGYCLIEMPLPYQGTTKKLEQDTSNNAGFMQELSDLLKKYQMAGQNQEVLDVKQGKLTLEQINLIYQHLPVDLSFVDEHDLVKFYSDTKHRVFPRSAGVIGRAVQNCHPRESVSTVEEIIRAFKTGEQEEAEFWLEMGDKFIYIIYRAVRDTNGNFRGVLEMMQDVTKIRSLTGSQRLLSWNQEQKTEEKKGNITENPYGITEQTIVGDLVKEYPYIKEFLLSLSPKFQKLKNPILFKTMSQIATLEMISSRGDFETSEFIQRIVEEIQIHSK